MGRGPLEDVTRCHVTRRVTTAPYGVRREGAREVGGRGGGSSTSQWEDESQDGG